MTRACITRLFLGARIHENHIKCVSGTIEQTEHIHIYIYKQTILRKAGRAGAGIGERKERTDEQ